MCTCTHTHEEKGRDQLESTWEQILLICLHFLWPSDTLTQPGNLSNKDAAFHFWGYRPKLRHLQGVPPPWKLWRRFLSASSRSCLGPEFWAFPNLQSQPWSTSCCLDCMCFSVLYPSLHKNRSHWAQGHQTQWGLLFYLSYIITLYCKINFQEQTLGGDTAQPTAVLTTNISTLLF